MFEELETINIHPEPFEFYTASDLWTDDYVSKKMLSFHLDENVDVASRNIEFVNQSVEWITSHFNIKEGTKIADFGCGPGIYTSRLARKQADVTGIDFSTSSLQHAQEAAFSEELSIKYINSNYLEFESSDRFQLILMIMCDFCALSSEQRRHMLSKFYNLLESGGSVLLDVYSVTAFEKREETVKYEVNLLDGFWSPNKYYGFLNTFKYEEDKVILDKYTIIEAARTRTIYNWLQCFTPEELELEFTAHGFAIDQIYADVAGTPYNSEGTEFAVVAKKP